MDSNYKNSEKLSRSFYRENIFQVLYDNLGKKDINEEFLQKIQVVLTTIKNLERIMDGKHINGESENKEQEFSIRLSNNLSEVSRSPIINAVQNLDEYINEIRLINEDENLSSKQKLSKVFRFIEEWVKIHNYSENVHGIVRQYEEKGFNKVFLSYAYDDKLYTIGLFFYFMVKNIFLYVDWMHNGKINNGIKLKYILQQKLRHSKQFLFLDTISSQFQISGNWNIRQWCAWEIGCYNRLGYFDNKFYLSIYDDTQTEKRLMGNLMLHDFRQLYDVKSGILQ